MGLATGTGVALVGNGTAVALIGDGTAVAGARDGTGVGEEQGRPDLPGGLGTGVGTAGTGQATAVGSADGAGTGVPLGREVATGIGVALIGDGTGVAGDVAVGAVMAVSRVAGALAECDATPEAAAPPTAEAGPEHPVSASPAATPNTAPIATRDFFSFDRIRMLLDVVPTIRTPANTSRRAKSCVRRAATFQCVQPYKHKRGCRLASQNSTPARPAGGHGTRLLAAMIGLWNLTLSGDRDADFAEFARASYEGLRRAAYLLTGDRHTAEDAAQTALVRTYAAWSRVRRDDAYAYARKVLVNHVTDRWRRRLRQYPVGDLPEQDGTPDPADEVALRHWLTGALATLTAKERAVIVMRYLFDLPEAAVARDLGVTVGTVKSTSSRALAKLRVRADDALPAQPIGGDRR